MKRLWRMSWKALVAVSALLFAVTLYGTSRDLRLTFLWHGAASELAWRDGRVWLDNDPQLKIEDARASYLDWQRYQAAEQREASAWQNLQAQTPGTATYEKASDQLNHLREVQAAEWSEWMAREKPAGTSSVKYSCSIALLLCVAAVAPVVGMLTGISRLGRLPRLQRDRVYGGRRLNLLAAVAGLSAMMWAATLLLYLRSLFIQDVLLYVARSPARLAVTNTQLWSLKGYFQCEWSKRVYAFRRSFDREDPDNASNIFTPNDNLLIWYTPGLTHYTRPAIGLLGLRFERTSGVRTAPGTAVSKRSSVMVSAPLWPLMLLWAIAPLMWVRRRLRIIRNAGRSLCASCGYDLRETPGRCPECGSVPAAVE